MKTNRILYLLASLLVIVGLYSCDNENVTPEAGVEDLVLLAEKPVPGTELTFKIYQYTDSLIVGYNRFEILLSKTGKEGAFTAAEIKLMPMMDMGDMEHACPVENPIAGTNFDGVFAGAVVFSMPSGDMGSWTLSIKVKDTESDVSGEVVLPVIITMPAESRMKSFMIGDAKYLVSLVEPSAPKVGINDFEVTVHKKHSMMEWPAIETFTITIEPEMPSMGHGSPNNVNPVHASDGHYKGKVNFTMDGTWRVNMTLQAGGSSQETYFDITF